MLIFNFPVLGFTRIYKISIMKHESCDYGCASLDCSIRGSVDCSLRVRVCFLVCKRMWGVVKLVFLRLAIKTPTYCPGCVNSPGTNPAEKIFYGSCQQATGVACEDKKQELI